MDHAPRPAVRRALSLLAAAGILAACAGGDTGGDASGTTAPTMAASPTTGASPTTAATALPTAASALPTTGAGPSADHPRWFDRILVVVMENAGADAALRVPELADLAARGTRYAGSRAVAHPSEPNYLAMIGGDTFVTDDGVHDLAGPNLVDLLEAHGVSWQAYLEGWPGGCSPVSQATDGDGLRYARKHDPFISFDDVRTDPARCDHLVDGGRFAADLAAGALPQYGFFVPDLRHDGHDTSVTAAGRWLAGFLEPLLADPRAMAGTLVVVTWDEAPGPADPSRQPILTFAIGAGATPGAVDPTPLDHYSLLRTVEDNWGLGTLGRHDDDARPLPLGPATGTG